MPQNRIHLWGIWLFLWIGLNIIFAQPRSISASDFLENIIASDADFIVQDTFDANDGNPGDGICATSYGSCTLRAAITEANVLPGEQRIYVLPGTYPLTQAGSLDDDNTWGDFDITDDLVLIGSSRARTIIEEAVSGGSYDRIIDIDPQQTGITVTIANLKLQSTNVSGDDGVIFRNQGNLTLENIEINDSVGAPMIYNMGTLTVNHSQLADNVVSWGALHNTLSGTVMLQDSLITRNRTINCEQKRSGNIQPRHGSDRKHDY